ncbi:MAG TPA: NAD-dependent epimerase/dehydratase family protein [Pseudolabrys sp.]|nr:NAD-dependent epimerase/dehydratase family protein [Pseudolabrys sp.]
MTRVLVTGGSGFVGRHLVPALLAQGDAVRIFDVSPPGNLARVQYVAGSILDAGAVRAALRDIDEVYHLAALPGMWMPRKRDFHAVNCRGTAIVVTAARRQGVRRFLHCSTESVLFGGEKADAAIAAQARPSIDDMPGAYTRSKLAAEQLAVRAAAAGVPFVIATPTIPIGLDANSTPPTAMLRHFLTRHRRFYLDFTLNLIDVRDVAAGLVLTMARGRIGERYILGGENIRLSSLLDRIDAICGRRRRRIPLPGAVALGAAALMEWSADHVTRRPPPATVEGVRIALRSAPLAIDKARRELGYSPRPVEAALRETVARILGERRGGRAPLLAGLLLD